MKTQIKNFCEQIGISVEQFYGKKEIKGYLDLRSLTSIPDGLNPTVGVYIYLSSVTYR